jgi:hypothetical protein
MAQQLGENITVEAKDGKARDQRAYKKAGSLLISVGGKVMRGRKEG